MTEPEPCCGGGGECTDRCRDCGAAPITAPVADDDTVERVAVALYQQFHTQAADMMHPDALPYTYSPWGADSIVTAFWHDVTRAGLATITAQPKPSDGVTLIALERQRQIARGWTAGHDDRHPGDQLVQAAMFYADPGASATEWPWDTFPTRGTRIRDLERAGALLAAEIDRLHRAAGAL